LPPFHTYNPAEFSSRCALRKLFLEVFAHFLSFLFDGFQELRKMKTTPEVQIITGEVKRDSQMAACHRIDSYPSFQGFLSGPSSITEKDHALVDHEK
jgi:hypothetical protein